MCVCVCVCRCVRTCAKQTQETRNRQWRRTRHHFSSLLSAGHSLASLVTPTECGLSARQRSEPYQPHLQGSGPGPRGLPGRISRLTARRVTAPPNPILLTRLKDKGISLSGHVRGTNEAPLFATHLSSYSGAWCVSFISPRSVRW